MQNTNPQNRPGLVDYQTALTRQKPANCLSSLLQSLRTPIMRRSRIPFIKYPKKPLTPSTRPKSFLTLFLLTLLFLQALMPLAASANSPAVSTLAVSPPPVNQLDQHLSPYLAMHGQDPVQWVNWDAAALERAQTENKPLLISSGYFACHWCHVMQRENYHDLQTATYLNQHFINVKIDRELNPELDKVLIEFARQTTGQAGWPQHVILTPEGLPFAAFIYLPNAELNNTLQRIVQFWSTQAMKIRALAQQAADISVDRPVATSIDSTQFSKVLLQKLERAKDDFSGGLKSSANKFPQAPLLQALLQSETLPNDIEEWLLLTLDQMQSEHLFDHIHGGFYRYTIDPEWQTPHFEKMAYTSALLADVYLRASVRFSRPDYLQTALDTLDYLRYHLYNPTTKLYRGSQSAIDANAVEGGDYLWTKLRLKQTLSAQEFAEIDQAWSLHNPAPYDALGWHPTPLNETDNSELWPKIRAKLQADPLQIAVDSKSILGWNGLILSALSRAYAVTQDPNTLAQANELAKVLNAHILQERPARALSQEGVKMGEANLQDYAFIYQALKVWHQQTKTILVDSSDPANPQTTSHKRFKADLAKLEQTILTRFYTESGWRYHASPLLPGQQGEWSMADDAIPSPTALVSCLKPESIKFAAQTILTQPLEHASYLSILDCFQEGSLAASGGQP